MVTGKKFTYLVCILNLLIVILLLSGCTEKETITEKTLTIQQLINQAKDSDTVLIPSGIFYETIEINKPLTLLGENKHHTIIDGIGNRHVILIKNDNVCINNITIRNSGGYKENSGIRIQSDNNHLQNCIIYRTKTGVYVDESTNNRISDCYFHTNGDGIYVRNSNSISIDDSEFQHNAFGIHVHNSEEITINRSYIHTNGLGVYARTSESLKIVDCAISDHNQDGGGCWVFDSHHLEISNCNINHNGAGLKLQNTEGIISNSNFYNNMFISLYLKNSEDIVIQNCNIKKSFRTAVKVENSICQITQNNIQESLLNGFECDKDSVCDIRNNWWGHRFGPSLLNSIKDEKISTGLRNVRLFPWRKTSSQDAGSTWSTYDVFSKTAYDPKRLKHITFDGQDTDGDGIPDWWENKWGYRYDLKENHATLDPDMDGLNNREECYTDSYGSNPFYKDIFIEVDWLKDTSNEASTIISDEYIAQAKDIFKDHQIHLHIDTGNLDGGEEIPVSSTSSFADLRDLYWRYFLHHDLDNPRKGIFHYMIVMNENPQTYEGFVFIGWDHLDGMSLCIKSMQDHYEKRDRSELIIYGIIHELGHQLGLLIDDFGGIDNIGSSNPFSMHFLKFLEYKSVMNYQKYLRILSYSDGTNGKNDFDDWKNLDFSFFKDTRLDYQ